MRYVIRRKEDGKFYKVYGIPSIYDTRNWVENVEDAYIFRNKSSIVATYGDVYILIDSEWVRYQWRNPDHKQYNRLANKLTSKLTSEERKKRKRILDERFEILPVSITLYQTD